MSIPHATEQAYATHGTDPASDLTKREYFAALAMQRFNLHTLIKGESMNFTEAVASTAQQQAQAAVIMADALIAALNEPANQETH